jgi:PAS domain S-box-containing protein
MLAIRDVDQLVNTAVSAVRSGDGYEHVLDRLPAPVYTTDAAGRITYWNQACADLVGRQPRLHDDQWCVTWRLYTTTGEPLPHEECPMARAIREQRAIRNEVIIVERPDGKRLACRPYPTPCFDGQGNLAGAVNLLVDVTLEQAGALTDQASRCRRLARATNDPKASEILAEMAQDYAAAAATLRDAESPATGS